MLSIIPLFMARQTDKAKAVFACFKTKLRAKSTVFSRNRPYFGIFGANTISRHQGGEMGYPGTALTLLLILA